MPFRQTYIWKRILDIICCLYLSQKIDIIIRSKSVHSEGNFEEMIRYMKSKIYMTIEEGIKNWYPENTLELD